jgi:magnesium-transporting ATPase (P-type)
MALACRVEQPARFTITKKTAGRVETSLNVTQVINILGQIGFLSWAIYYIHCKVFNLQLPEGVEVGKIRYSNNTYFYHVLGIDQAVGYSLLMTIIAFAIGYFKITIKKLDLESSRIDSCLSQLTSIIYWFLASYVLQTLFSIG